MTAPPERRSYDHELGNLEARMTNVEVWLKDVSTDVKAIRSAMDQQRGGWKVITTLCTVSGLLGGVAAKMLLPR